MAPTSYAIAIGSNRRHGRHGGPDHIIRAAMAALAEAGLRIIAVSPILRTRALGPAGRGFANAAAIIETPLDPPALLALLKGIERSFGRRPGRRWGPRVLDLDILLWSQGDWPPRPRAAAPGRLHIPHRDLAQRDFVLTPLGAMAPSLREAGMGQDIRHLIARLRRRAPISG
jgi:2-amino-4-hydroxy-6-hydroxymethyldihydropteridine diphosphokinase